jgi:soluble lytic murein transglycosylase
LRFRHFSTFVLLAFALLGCVASSDEDGTPTPEAEPSLAVETPPAGSPVATATISLTPPPNSTPADLHTAQRLEAEGELSRALEAYLTLTTPVSSSRATGVHGAARVLLEMERPAEARNLLEPFLASSSAPAEVAPARYLLARAYTALSMYNEALQQYDLYIQSGRIAAPYANLDRARILMDFGEPLTAASEAQIGLNANLPSVSKPTFVLIAAQSYEKAGVFADALRLYQTLYDTSPANQPRALSRIAAIKQSQGDPGYSDDLVRLMANFPATQLALETLGSLDAAGRPVDSYIRGLVHYRHNDYAKAEPAFRERIAASPNDPASAESYYYLAAILESRGQMAEALDLYARVTALNPASGLADDALWWRGRILEDSGRTEEARGLYSTIVSSYPSSSWAADAAFRPGMLAYRSGNYREAANIWGQGLFNLADAVERQRLVFWQGKALLKSDDRTAAEPLLRTLASSGEDDYYGVRAVAALEGDHNQPQAERDSNADLEPEFDWAAAESWLASKAGRPVSGAAVRAWSSDPRWLRAQELWLVGRTGQANAEAFDLIEAHARDPVEMYWLARTLDDMGQFSLSARAGQRLMRTLNTSPNAGLPKALLALSYPAPFASSIKKYADAERISPLLMLAFIRQESFFDPRAQSPASAYGLTQLLTPTAKAVAQRIGAGNVETEDLFEADLNIRLGTNYMATQLKDFENDILVAFAAYNAGPNAANRWRASAGNDDADIYLETVEFRESRLYVEIVAENYAIYRYLYGGEDLPALPSD